MTSIKKKYTNRGTLTLAGSEFLERDAVGTNQGEGCLLFWPSGALQEHCWEPRVIPRTGKMLRATISFLHTMPISSSN